MNSQKKSTGSRNRPDAAQWAESVARMHCLESLFPHWAEKDSYFLKQIKESIEATLLHEEKENSLENFSASAQSLRKQTPGVMPASYAFISLDFSNRTWDPLFARQEFIAEFKQQAGTAHIFLLIRGLRRALFPNAIYHTKNRAAAYEEATHFIDELAREWSTQSSEVHLLYI